MTDGVIQEKILFVDDEPNILASYLRQLRKKFPVETALSGGEALKALDENGPFAVVVSDLKMPGMDGISFLGKVRDIFPDTVRILLTGFADVNNAMKAINEGSVFRLLSKPCDSETLVRALVDALKQYRLISAERDLLQNTLSGSIKVLTEILSLLHPEAVGRSSRIKELCSKIARHLGMGDTWVLDSAAMLSLVGMIALPPEALVKLHDGEELAPDEQQIMNMHPMIGADLIKNIPRMDRVAQVIGCQDIRFDSKEELPFPELKAIPLESLVIKAAQDYDLLLAQGNKPKKALYTMTEQKGVYSPKVLKALNDVLDEKPVPSQTREVVIADLTESMVFLEDVVTTKGRLVVPKGQRVTRLLVRHLENFNRSFEIQEPLKVKITGV